MKVLERTSVKMLNRNTVIIDNQFYYFYFFQNKVKVICDAKKQ